MDYNVKISVMCIILIICTVMALPCLHRFGKLVSGPFQSVILYDHCKQLGFNASASQKTETEQSV